ncbi:transglutaminase-like domain-containing protein [Nonomuraea sp. NPDC050643]|uniref:transglutaminase-like domain-containing protein n=1 Tax=Nonomuraea sp. NPDC050643 TaxID=3155660 RepID=UPI0033D31D78
MPDATTFYATQSVFSSPGDLARLYADLPPDPAGLARIVRNLMIHRWEGGLFGYDLPEDRLRDDAETRYVDGILAIIAGRDGSSLTRRRDPDRRFVGVCRDFALLHCSFLRHAGIPARVRSGFATYFRPEGFHHDHMIGEHWDGEHGWRLSDPQLTDPAVYPPMDFDPMDVPRDRFLTAGTAWRLLRAGEADAATFGLYRPDLSMSRENFVAGNVLLDIAAVNKAETLVWDVWGAIADIDDGITDADRELYDRIAEVTAGDGDLEAARTLFLSDHRLRPPATILSLAPYNGQHQVTLRPPP